MSINIQAICKRRNFNRRFIYTHNIFYMHYGVRIFKFQSNDSHLSILQSIDKPQILTPPSPFTTENCAENQVQTPLFNRRIVYTHNTFYMHYGDRIFKLQQNDSHLSILQSFDVRPNFNLCQTPFLIRNVYTYITFYMHYASVNANSNKFIPTGVYYNLSTNP